MKKLICLLLLCSSISFAQDKKISQLTPLPSANGSELIPVARSGANYYMTTSQIQSYFNGSFWKNGLNALGSTGTFGTSDNNRIDFYSNNAIRGRLTSGGQWVFGSGFPGLAINSPLLAIGSGTTSSTYAFGVYDGGLTNNYFALRNDSRMIYKDGNQSAGYLLQSDANGVATWVNPSVITGSFVPLAGTSSGSPLTGLVEFAGPATTALWQNSATGSGYYLGTGTQKDLSLTSGTDEAYYIYFSPNSTDDIVKIYSQDGTGNGGLISSEPSNNTINAFDNTGNSTTFRVSSQATSIVSTYTAFQGFTYNPGTATNVVANQTQYSLLHRAAGDARWAPISGGAYLSNSLTAGKIYVGNGSNVGTAVTPSLNSSAGTYSWSTTGQVTIPDASAIGRGFLNSTDWNTFNNKSPAVGSTSLTTAGTFTTGTWNATSIGTQYGGTGANNATNTSGSILRSNGTNGSFVASTTTWPNTITANQVLYATGTNAIGSSSVLTFNGTAMTFNEGTDATTTILAFNGNAGNARGLFRIFNPSLGVGMGYFSANSLPVYIGSDNAAWATFKGSQLYIGSATAPTANLHLAPGTASANTAPLKFTSGTNLTTAEVGTFEYDGSAFYATPSGTNRYQIGTVLTATATLDFSSTSAQSSSDLTITVTGAAAGDAVSIGTPNGSVLSNSSYSAWVSASNTVTVRFNNYSSASQDPSSGTFKATVIKN